MRHVYVERSRPATAHRVGDAYRVGLGAALWGLRIDLILSTSWAEHRAAFRWFARTVRRGYKRRSWWGLWQAEHDGPQPLRARRGLTAQAARRRVILDVDRYDRGQPQRYGVLIRRTYRPAVPS